MSNLSDFSDFSLKELKARLKWIDKIIPIKEGKTLAYFLNQKELILKEIEKKNNN